MTTDPVQPESPTPNAAPETAPVTTTAEVNEQPIASVPLAEIASTPEATVPLEPAVSADPIGNAQAAAIDEAMSAAARARGKMTNAADVQITQTETSAPKQSPRGSIEIPGVDDLDSSLEAEIAAAMSGDTSTPPMLSAEVEETAPGSEPSKDISLGSKVKGTVQAIHGGDIFLDAGLRDNVVVSVTQFAEGKVPAVGDQLDVIIDNAATDGIIKGRIPRARHRAAGNWDSLAVGQVVDCLVTAVNKGGLQVTVSSLRAFLPASQVELGFAGNLDVYLGQKLSVQVTEVNAKKRNLVVSRRALLQAERSEGEGEFWAGVEVGQDFKGTVKTLKDYGAFVNIGPVDGFLHIGEISWSRINHPKDVLAEGQEVDVKILKLDAEKKRISLGMKQLAQNPWSSAAERYATGNTVSGKVTRLTEFGAFIELEAGLEGMVHISELAWRRVGSVGEILKVGETRDFQVVEVDTKRKRVSLSLKALEKRPEPPKSERVEEPEPQAPVEPRKPRNTNLRGGTGSASGRGMFGNPSDFT